MPVTAWDNVTATVSSPNHRYMIRCVFHLARPRYPPSFLLCSVRLQPPPRRPVSGMHWGGFSFPIELSHTQAPGLLGPVVQSVPTSSSHSAYLPITLDVSMKGTRRKKALTLFLSHCAQLCLRVSVSSRKGRLPRGRNPVHCFPVPPLRFCQLKGPDKLGDLRILMTWRAVRTASIRRTFILGFRSA